MAISVFPVPSSGGGVNANTLTLTSANILYKSAINLAVGVYTITASPTSSNVFVNFWSGDTLIGSTTTVSGTITFNLGTAADLIYAESTGANTNVTFTLVANSAIVSDVSGTLDTLTTSQTYTQTGKAYVVVVGGGGGGLGQMFGNQGRGGPGGGGGLNAQPTVLSGSTVVTIGTAGTAGTGGNGAPSVVANAGGATSFGSITANGGSGGSPYNGSNAGTSGGTPSGRPGSGALATGQGDSNGGSNANPATFVVNGNNGGGGGYGNGGGTNIGVGGRSLGNATGRGAGGGGSESQGNAATTGGNGTAGVVYVLRGLV